MILHAAGEATLARIARIHGEYHDVAPADPRTRIDAFSALLRERGYQIGARPRRRKPNLGLFFATRPEVTRCASPSEASPRCRRCASYGWHRRSSTGAGSGAWS